MIGSPMKEQEEGFTPKDATGRFKCKPPVRKNQAMGDDLMWQAGITKRVNSSAHPFGFFLARRGCYGVETFALYILSPQAS
jgi:hypothetical protein